ncbi:MAG: NAD-binding protein, partial [Vallitaleaceae bacterium]|nr:NAD-binding protein [Vallitaleaceae bacterium]
ERLGENSGISMILGTGIDYDILESAGIREADALLSLTNGDNTNIMVAQIAQNIFGVKKVIARIVDLRVKRFYEEEMGLTCYCHTEVSSEHYLSMLKGVDTVCTSL